MSRAKNHDLRKGQWLFMKIYKDDSGEFYTNEEIVRHIRVMENDEFDCIMEDYNN